MMLKSPILSGFFVRSNSGTAIAGIKTKYRPPNH